MTDGLRKSHLRKAPQVGLSEVGLPEGNLTFQPLIDYISSKRENAGYNLGEAKVITKPFADDFEIITADKGKHQKL